MKEYDLIVIGAGPGGYEAAFEASGLGMKTALVEKDAVGGTCLNRGCIPTKALLHSAELYKSAADAGKFGVSFGEVSYDPVRIRERKEEVVLKLRQGIEGTAKRKKTEIIYGKAVIEAADTVRVISEEDEELLRAKHILIATGSVPVLPPIPGSTLPGVVTSDGLLNETEKIGRLVIIGGGVIGMEFAAAYAMLGTQVTVIEAMPQILPNLDKEIARSLKMQRTKDGVQIRTNARVKEIRQEADGSLVCDYTEEAAAKDADAGELLHAEADRVLIAVGRRAYTEGLFKEGAAPETDRGRIVVNENFETSVPGIYAIGDVTGGVMLAHYAAAAGKNAVRRMLGLPDAADLKFVPSCIYTKPEIACVGMTEDEAKTAGIPYSSRKVLMGANGKTVVTDRERGYIRVVFEKESGKILGAQMMCERATDMISEFTEALTLGLTTEDLARAIRPHPTYSEAITEALRD